MKDIKTKLAEYIVMKDTIGDDVNELLQNLENEVMKLED